MWLALNVGCAASWAAQWVASAIPAYESQDLGGIVRVRSWFAHTILRYAEQMFDLVGYRAGDVLLRTRTYVQLIMDLLVLLKGSTSRAR